MPKAFVLIDVRPGTESEVQEKITKLYGVNMCYQTTGDHDLIAFVEAEPYEAFATIVAQIRGVDGVDHTETELVLK